MNVLRARMCALVLLGTFAGVATAKGQAQTYVKDTGPNLFTYDELLQLNREPISPTLAEKLKAVTTTPFVNNEGYLRGARSRPLTVRGWGPHCGWRSGTSSGGSSWTTSSCF